MNGLNHNALTCSAVPIPPWERSLQTVEAQPYFNVSQASLVLEGIVFDRNIHAILPGLAVGNGIAIDPAGSQIWATEHAKNRLHRVRLSDATTVAPFGSVVTYQFTGPAPDGARVDSEGNVYVAIFIASNYVCDRVLHWYKGNQHAPLNGVMSFFHKQTTFSYASLGPKSV
ncbi:SMP-30/gluconolactonase/LRE family protein [Klebsiella pneumoniae]